MVQIDLYDMGGAYVIVVDSYLLSDQSCSDTSLYSTHDWFVHVITMPFYVAGNPRFVVSLPTSKLKGRTATSVPQSL